jgi:hypothetical protein
VNKLISFSPTTTTVSAGFLAHNMFSSGTSSQEFDPLTEALRPSPNETPVERQARLENEERARQVSQAIDASLKAERLARRKKRVVRLLLLGQSESGKSTTLRREWIDRIYIDSAYELILAFRVSAAVYPDRLSRRTSFMESCYPA